MSLPFELTTFPKGAVEIIRYLALQDSYAAFDDDIMDATGLSDRAYGKAIRRLVTKEYIELQYEGSYALTEIGVEAAEAVAAHDEETQYEAAMDDDDFVVEEEFIEIVETLRNVLVVYPRTLGAGQPAYLFLRVVDTPGDALPVPVDVVFELRGGDVQVMPEQSDTAISETGAAAPVRFEVTPGAAGRYPVTITALQVTKAELLPVGEFTLELTAAQDAAPDSFLQATFAMLLQPGL